MRTALLQRTVVFLEAVAKKEFYGFQNFCLKVMSKLLSDEKKKISADTFNLHYCSKILQIYLMRKPTREDARPAQQAL